MRTRAYVQLVVSREGALALVNPTRETSHRLAQFCPLLGSKASLNRAVRYDNRQREGVCMEIRKQHDGEEGWKHDPPLEYIAPLNCRRFYHIFFLLSLTAEILNEDKCV